MPRAMLTFLVALVSMLSPALGRDDARLRAEIEATLGSISRAVLAADQGAYLAHIDRSEPHFAAEHTHWSDELVRHRPAEFALAIGEGAAMFAEDAAEFPMVMSWKFESGPKDNWGTDPQGRRVTFPTVRFAKKDGRWLYRGEKWKEAAAPDGSFLVRFLAGSEKAAEDVVKAFPVAKAHVDSEFGRPVRTAQTLVLYQSMDHLKATVYLNMPDRVLGGWSEAGESVKFMDSYARGVPAWTAAYAHEYAHVATWELGPGSRTMPWWVQEGVAELCAGAYRPGYAQTLDAEMRARAAAGTLADWAGISDYLTTEPRLKRLAYTQGDHMVSFITTKFTRESRNSWLGAMAGGASLEEATRKALGIGFDELDRRWRADLAAAGADAKAPATPEPAGVREALVQGLRDMTDAVAAGDAKKYLALVSPSDAVFFKEQENWAKDLERHVPESVQLLLGEAPLGVEPDGSIVGEVTTNWRMAKGKDRTITFPARFVRGEAGWLYAGEKWLVHEGDRSRVMYEDESLKEVAAAVAEVLPEIRAHVDEGFGFSDNAAVTGAVQQVKLYTSMKHLQHSIYLSYTDGLSGWNEPGEAIKILATAGSRKGMLRVLLGHEYGHVATFHLGPRASDMPWWILEGVAELSSAKYSGGSARLDRMVKGWAKADKLIAWDRLADFRGEAANHTLNVYNQGHHMVAYIANTFGRAKLNEWMKAMAQGGKLEESTVATLGLGFAELDAKWRGTLAEAPAEPGKP